MVGADSAEVLEKVMPLLKETSTHVFPMGGLGAGHTMKTLNNYVSVGSIIALNDALVSCMGPQRWTWSTGRLFVHHDLSFHRSQVTNSVSTRRL